MIDIRIMLNVLIGPQAEIGEFVIIGLPPKGSDAGDLPTIIGSRCVIRSHSVLYAGNRIGSDFQTGHHVLIRESNVIGDAVSIGSNTVVEHHILIGNGVRIHSSAFIPEYSVLEDGCWVGPNVVITNAKYPRSAGAKATLKAPVIRRNAIIGANCTLLPGVEIGEKSLVGAGTVVTHDVPPRVVVYGNPARVVKSITDIGAY